MARPKGNKWIADVTIDGKRVRPTFNTREEAERYELLVSQGYRPDRKHTLEAYLKEHFNEIWGDARSRHSIEGNWRVIFRYIEPSTMLDSISRQRIDKIIYDMKQDGKKGSTINRKIANLSKLLKHAYHNKHITELPELKRQREPNGRERVLSHEEEDKIIKWFDQTNLPLAKHLFVFMLYTGCRVGEALSLTRDKVTNGYITFHHTNTKNGKTRVIPIVPKAAEAWKAACRMNNHDRPFGDAIPYRTFKEYWDRMATYMGFGEDDEFVPHMLRHTCATRLVKGGVPLVHVMKWLGHSSMKTTLRYANLVPTDLDIAAKALE